MRRCVLAALAAICCTSLAHAGNPVPLPQGYTWQQDATMQWGIQGPKGDWYVPPEAKNGERLAMGWYYEPTPELSIPRGVWGTPCQTVCGQGKCETVCVVPEFGQHGVRISKPESEIAAASACDPKQPYKFSCKPGCLISSTETVTPIPFRLTPTPKVIERIPAFTSPEMGKIEVPKKATVEGRVCNLFSDGQLKLCDECNK